MRFSYSNRSKSRGCSWEREPGAYPDDLNRAEADVCIIGAGISGLATAVRCAQLGLSVIVADKRADAVPHGQYLGVVPSGTDKKIFAKRWLKASGSRVNEDLLWLYMNQSEAALQWLTDLGGIQAIPVKSRYLNPTTGAFPGDYELHPTGEYSEEGGALLLEVLEDALKRLGGVIYRPARATLLEKDETGRVVSFVAQKDEDTLIRFVAKKAVVLAAGDCGGDEEMLAALSPVSLKAGKNASLNTGDGQKLAYWVGAELDGLYWAPNLDCSAYGPYSFFFTAVNRDGRRFMNEDTSIQAKARHCMNQRGGEYAYSICDAKWFDELSARMDYVGGESVAPKKLDVACIESECGENLFCAESIEELAEKIGVCPETLNNTVKRVNELVAMGEDVDYGKRSELLTTIERAPYYAFKWGPSLRCCYGGAIVDTGMHVNDPDDYPIPGLYAVGACAGGFYAIGYPTALAGSGFGSALTFALAAAETIAKEE